MYPGQGQGAWYHSQDGQIQPGISASSQQQHQPYSLFPELQQPHQSAVPSVPAHQPEQSYSILTNTDHSHHFQQPQPPFSLDSRAYQPYVVHHDSYFGPHRPAALVQPHATFFQSEIPQIARHLPHMQQQGYDQGYPPADVPQPSYEYVSNDHQHPRHYQRQALMDQYLHPSMTGQRTYQVGSSYPARNEGSSSHSYDVPMVEDVDEEDLSVLPPLPVMRKDGAATNYLRSVVEHFYKIWKRRVPNPAQCTAQSLADEVVRVEAFLGQSTPFRTFTDYIFNNMQESDERSFKERLRLVRWIYDAVLRNYRGYETSTVSQQARENAIQEAISLLNRVARAAALNFKDEKAAKQVDDVIDSMISAKHLIGNQFRTYLSTQEPSLDLGTLQKKRLQAQMKYFAKDTPVPLFESGKLIFSGRGEILRTLTQYVKAVRQFDSDIEPTLDNYSYLLDIGWYATPTT